MADVDESAPWQESIQADDWFTRAKDFLMNKEVDACVTAGNALTATLDAKIEDIGRNWNPLPTFTGQQIRAVAASVLQVIDQAQAAINEISKQELNPIEHRHLDGETVSLTRHRAQAETYLQAAQVSDDNNQQPVAAPNIKQWVINAMNASSNAMVQAYTSACIPPPTQSEAAYDTLLGTVKAIGGTALALGQAAISVVEGVVTAAAFSARVFKFVASYWPLMLLVVLGGAYAWHRKKTYGYVLPQGLRSKLPFPAFFEPGRAGAPGMKGLLHG